VTGALHKSVSKAQILEVVAVATVATAAAVALLVEILRPAHFVCPPCRLDRVDE